MTTEREMRQADEEMSKLVKANFGRGKRLKSVDEMPESQRISWKQKRAEKRLYRLMRKKERMVRRKQKDWLLIFVTFSLCAVALYWLVSTVTCQLYKPPHYYDWKKRHNLGPWQEMSDMGECRMNLREMVMRGEWRLTRRNAPSKSSRSGGVSL